MNHNIIIYDNMYKFNDLIYKFNNNIYKFNNSIYEFNNQNKLIILIFYILQRSAFLL